MEDPRLEPHDSNQLELKLAYVVDPGVKRQHYLVESFMFVPRTLGVSGQSYSAQRFYEDTATFVRLKTPSVALEALAATGRAARWFDPVRESLDRLLGGAAVDGAGLVRGLKLLGAIYRASIRDEGRLLLDRFDALSDAEPKSLPMQEQDLAETLERFVGRLGPAVERLRVVGRRCEHTIVPGDIRDIWGVVDEYVAIYAEEIATALVAACDTRLARDAGGSALAQAREKLADVAVSEYRYRRSRGYPSYAVPGAPNENIPRRRRILKRIISSVLFLEQRHEEGGTKQRDIIAGVAAAAAMLFAVLVARWAQLEWGVLSSGFVLMMVLSYIVKDRLKEWAKRYLGRRLARWLPDYVTKVRDPQTGQVIGSSRESVSVADSSRVPKDIRNMRHSDHPAAIAEHGRSEVVIRFVKEVTLDSKGLANAMTGVEGLSDIIRFNFAHFRQRMDDVIETYRIVHPDSRRIVEVRCRRVYHINLVLRITRGAGERREAVAERVRVVLDQRGILRVEEVDAIGATQHSGLPSADLLGGFSERAPRPRHVRAVAARGHTDLLALRDG
ncbi:MAG: hypothetical protein CVU56_06740 [Deltaproteobacteria bacterium HGW-Deltaproteobacteria-14]|nr:MAG: hypothetical protein CVU56_06740 [Deltaproteobacteria bacterium HGW-Deltaproteobacteria-14]